MENLEPTNTSTGTSGKSKIKPDNHGIQTPLEAQVISRSGYLNIPSLCAMFELTQDEVEAILLKHQKRIEDGGLS
jgi:hypothetical protein